MALADSIAALSRYLQLEVWIQASGNWVLITPNRPTEETGVPGIEALQISKSYVSPNPVMRVTVNKIPRWVNSGKRVFAKLGYDGSTVFVFQGYVASREPKAPGASQIVCTGQLTNVFRKSELAERDVDGITVESAIGALLDASNVWSHRHLDIPVYTMGASANIDAKLERGTIGQMLELLMGIDGCRMTERGNGQVRIEPVDLLPAPTPFRLYSSQNDADPHIIGGGTQENPSDIKTRMTVRGATVVSGTPPNETSDVIEGIAIADQTLVQPPMGPGEYIDDDYSNHLIDTVAKAEEVAERLLAERARIPRIIRLQIPGDPELELGYTLRMDFPNIGVEGDFIIASIVHTITEDAGFVTVVGLIGGPSSGVTIATPPTANFSYEVVTHVQGTGGVLLAQVTFDASASFAPDGKRIITYEWSDNKVTTPEIAATDQMIRTVVIDPTIVDNDWDVTLTVTDDEGLTGTYTKEDIEVPIAAVTVELPAIWVAGGSYASVSPDGGQNWIDLNFVTDFTAVAARPPDGNTVGWGCWGTADGRILRTLDFVQDNLTQALAPSGTQIEDIKWDWRMPSDIWAINTIGKVYRSQNLGYSFELYSDLRVDLDDANLITYSIGLPGIGGNRSIWIYGGNGNGVPLIVRRGITDAIWSSVQMVSGDLGSDIPGPAGVYIKDAQDNGDGRGFVMILASAGDGVYGLYHCSNPNASNPNWSRPQGVGSALTEGRFVVGDFSSLVGFHAAFNNRDIYHSNNGKNWTVTSDVLPAGVTPNHAIWLRDEIHSAPLASVHMIGGENAGATEGLYVSSDGLETVTDIRPATGFPAWATGSKIKKVAVGPSPGGDASMVTVSEQPSDSSRWVQRKLFTPNWIHEDIPTALSSSLYHRMRPITNQTWFVFGFDARTDYASVVPMRTADGGDSFATMANPTGNFKFIDVCRDAQGQFWGLAIDVVTPANVKIYYSTIADAGADGTWVESYSASHGTHGLCTIYAHPTAQGRIYVTGHKNTDDLLTIFTLDRGSSWDATNLFVNGASSADRGVQADFRCLGGSQNNRLVGVVGKNSGNTDIIVTSDNNGAAWTQRFDASTPAGNFLLGPVGTHLGGTLYFAYWIAGTGVEWVAIVRSTNGATDWEQMQAVIKGESGDTPTGGIAYSEVEDALYLKWSGGHTVERNYVYRMAPVISAGIWQDFTSDIFPPGVTSLANSGACQSMGIIPL